MSFDDELDDTFELISLKMKKEKEKNQQQNGVKKNENNEKEEKNDNQKIYCKVCGKEVLTISSFSKCKICGVNICKKCSSCGFCLNCFIHIKEEPRKTLKFARIMALFIPAFTIFLLIYGFIYYVLVNLFLVGFFIFYYAYTQKLIIKKKNLSLESSWLDILNSDYYNSLRNPENSRRYVDWKPFEENESAEKVDLYEKKISIITPYKDAALRSNEDFDVKPDDVSIEKLKVPKIESVSLDYILIDKSCPNCGQIIKFADFCVECNLKFCPICEEGNNPYSSKCLCGCEFPNIENEFEKYLKENEIENKEKLKKIN